MTIDSVNSGKSIYHSLQSRFQKRTSNGFTMVGAYTYSKVILYQMGSLVNHREYQRFVPEVDHLDPSAFERLADEYSITPEPEFYGWLRGPAPIEHSLTLFKNINMYEAWRLELRAEIRNPFNSPQFENPITDISSDDFGRIMEAEGERTIMVGAKLRF